MKIANRFVYTVEEKDGTHIPAVWDVLHQYETFHHATDYLFKQIQAGTESQNLRIVVTLETVTP